MSKRDPRTKEEILDRMTRIDFSGDLRTLGAQGVLLERIKPHVLRMVFPETGQKYELTVHKPRPEATVAKMRAKLLKKRRRANVVPIKRGKRSAA